MPTYPENISRIERREYPRAVVDIPLFFVPCSADEQLTLDKLLKGKIVDLSAGGLKFISYEPQPVATDICLFFDLDGLSQVLFATVIRSEAKRLHYLIAVRFTDVTTSERTYLRDYVNGLLQSPHHWGVALRQ